MAAFSNMGLAASLSPFKLLLAEVPHTRHLTATEMEAAAN